MILSTSTRVPSSGPANARIMVVGEAPGRDEERERKPFVGVSGNLLRECLFGVGINPEDVYFANICKYRPPNNELRAWYDNSGQPNETVREGLNELRAEIESVNPHIIIPLGNYPLFHLTERARWSKEGYTGIGDYRGYLLPGSSIAGGRKCLPTYHPAAAIRQYPLKHIIRADLAKARAQSASPILQYTSKYILVDPRGPERDAWAAWLRSPEGTQSPKFRWNAPGGQAHSQQETSVASGPFLSGDIEYLGSSLLCFGLTRHRDVAIIFRTDTNSDINYVRDIVLSGIPLCFQNGMFDGSILEWFYDTPVIPLVKHDTMYMMHSAYVELPKDLGFIGSLYTNNPPWWQHINGQFWKDVRESKRPIEEVLPYNGYDVCSTHEAAEKLLADELQDPNVAATYAHEMALVSPLWTISRTGVLIDVPKLEKLQADLQEEVDAFNAGLCILNDGTEVNVMGGQQVAKFLYEKMEISSVGQPKTPSGKQWKMDDDTLAALSLKVRHKRQRTAIRLVREARERRSLISKFCEIELDDDGRMRCHYDPAKTDTGRLSSRKFYPTGNGCVPGDAEVLTPHGWKRFDTLGKQATALQWSPTGRLSWELCDVVTYDYNGPMVRADSWFHQGLYTPDHKVPFGDKYTQFVGPRPIQEVKDFTYWSLPVSGQYNGHFVSHPLIRLAVAAQADGSVEGNSIRFTFSKLRKVARFMVLCETLGVSYTEQQSSHGRRFRIGAADAKPIIAIINEHGYKTFGRSILTWDAQTLEDFVDELRYWDAHERGRSFQYYTTNQPNSEWVALAAHLTGHSASIHINRDNNQGYGQGVNKWLYTVAVKPRSYVRCEAEHFSEEQFSGKVYCLVTKTGYFLMRYNNQIVVTGNSNLQNVPRDPRVRAVFVPDRGCIFGYADLKSAESLVVAHITGDREMLRLHSPEYMSGGLDGHKYVASFLFNKAIDRVTKEERYLGKRVRHAGNYGMSWAKLMAVINAEAQETGVAIDAAQAKALIFKYRQLHPMLQSWWNDVLATLQDTHTLYSCHGRKRVFYDRPESILPEAIAYVPQSTVADTLNMGLLRVAASQQLQDLGFRMLLQVHDAIGFQIPEVGADTALRLLPELMSIAVPISRKGVPSYEISIPVEIQVGYNWGDFHAEKNPTGLKEWKP